MENGWCKNFLQSGYYRFSWFELFNFLEKLRKTELKENFLYITNFIYFCNDTGIDSLSQMQNMC